RSSQRPPRRSLQDRSWRARHAGRQEPQAGSQPLRREDGEEVMPRKGPAPKRPVVADPVYSSPVVSQLVNKILLDGKKGLAERIVYDALVGVAAKNGQDAVVTLKKA